MYRVVNDAIQGIWDQGAICRETLPVIGLRDREARSVLVNEACQLTTLCLGGVEHIVQQVRLIDVFSPLPAGHRCLFHPGSNCPEVGL
nr:MAG TPA: hypothetical protein [Caudoviricetes sp.]